MALTFNLKPMLASDHLAAKEVYADAICSQAELLYSQDQIRAWSSLAYLPGVLDLPLNEGKGWISLENHETAAFALRYPLNRLALLYCRGCLSRRGHASALLEQVEQEALVEGRTSLLAEASLFSYPLLLRRGWNVDGLEKIQIGGVDFDRYLMQKNL